MIDERPCRRPALDATTDSGTCVTHQRQMWRCRLECNAHTLCSWVIVGCFALAFLYLTARAIHSGWISGGAPQP